MILIHIKNSYIEDKRSIIVLSDAAPFLHACPEYYNNQHGKLIATVACIVVLSVLFTVVEVSRSWYHRPFKLKEVTIDSL